jgi:hypothetical protein
MRIARLDTPQGPRYAVWTGHAWEVVAGCFSDPPVSTRVSIAPDYAQLLAPCEPRVLVGIAHNTGTVNGTVKADSGTFNLALDRRREHRRRGPMGPSQAWRRDHEWLTEHVRVGHTR